ncbi:Hypothetical protein NTJ_06028 [Nesidiocoris tenuis]|uniref:Uncharacterized protein n=1 Tax=Nesidiocoris tenuis TaxID=355587 RepID=A0ABN7AMQ0_9HEMI|nr:Hypothetical protein NTJ_06028 [Nesidiocoris tenuis]
MHGPCNSHVVTLTFDTSISTNESIVCTIYSVFRVNDSVIGANDSNAKEARIEDSNVFRWSWLEIGGTFDRCVVVLCIV